MSQNPFAHPSAPPRDVSAPPSTTPCILCDATERRLLFHKHGYAFVRCQGCSLVQLDPLPDAATLAEVYEQSYREGAYSVFARAGDVRSATARARVAVIAPEAPLGPWLDVGCSTGALLEAAREAGIESEGFDLSAAAVEEAQRRGLRAVQASAETFEPTRRYACVTGFDVLEHLVDPSSFLERLHGWLAPGGRIALTVPDIKSLPARAMGRSWYYYAPPVHITYFDRDTVCRFLERHRFRPTVVTSAPKVMTADYALSQLEAFNPLVHRIARVAAAVLPASFRSRPLHIPTGEILVIASAAA